MLVRSHFIKPWSAFAGLALCVLVQVAHADAAVSDAASRLEQTEHLRTTDHPKFLRMLQELHAEEARLSPGERWHLRYLEAWQTVFQGDYIKADALLRDVIDHSGDVTLATKSSAFLMYDMGITNRYEEAFALANRLVAELPDIKDKLARFHVLSNLSQLLGSAGQYDLAIKYAGMMDDALPSGETLCNPQSMQNIALFYSEKLTSSSPELQEALDTCEAARQPVYADTLWLVKAELYIKEGQPDKAIALLNRITPDIRADRYQYNSESSQTLFAQAYWKLGEDTKARQAALAAIAMSSPDKISELSRDAYQVLYQIEKKHGNTAAALAYYEHYVIQDKGHLNDVSARAIAYQVAKQQVLTKELETEALGKQNNILRLQQALDKKAVEASRLYIVLLLMAIAFIVLWLYRLKRSQLRFRQLSRCDGLTGIFNHQHFISEADRVLRVLGKKRQHACLISIDLDHFKQVNDTHGHAMGDAVLKRTVSICQQQLRSADIFGRLGGEEFGVLLQNCTRDQGMEIAHRIRLSIEATPMMESGCVVSISASVGLASSDRCGYELQRLHTEADAALYRAKRLGRNRVIADIESGDLVEA